MKPLPDGPKGTWIKGVLDDYRRDALGFFTACARDYGDFVPLRFGPQKVFLLSHPDLIDEVLVQKYRSFVKGPALRNNRRVFGNGLLTSEGEFWRQQRKLAQPAFHRDRVNAYAEVMVDCTQRRIAQWRDGETRDIHDEMMRVTMEIAAKTLFGTGVEDIADEVAGCMHLLQTGVMRRFQALVNLPDWVPTPTHLRLLRAVRTLDRIVYGFIDAGRKSDEDRGDLLTALLNARGEGGERMSDQQLRDEVLTLFLAGHETTALALTWTLMLLAENPDAAARLHAEVDRVLEERAPTIDDRPRLEYTEWVVLESMRLYPPAWAIARTAIETCEIGGYRVPRGTMILMLQWTVHRDPRWFDQPEEFRPERWAGDFQKTLPRHAYFPFGGGPRTCIGNTFSMVEAVMLLATLVQSFSFRLAPSLSLVLQPAITLRPEHGLHMTVCRRDAPDLVK